MGFPEKECLKIQDSKMEFLRAAKGYSLRDNFRKGNVMKDIKIFSVLDRLKENEQGRSLIRNWNVGHSKNK